MELNLNVADYADTNDSYEPLPAGWYAATVEEESDQISQAGNEMLKLNFSLDTGRRVASWYNTGHPKKTVKEIAFKELTRLADACGLAALGKSAELVGRKCEIKLEPDGTWNKVKGYRALPRSAPPSSNGSAPQKEDPWER
jgi:hypothetical protein